MRSPLVDITTLNAVESLFRPGPRDPWGPSLVGDFADLFAYGDRVRFPLPTPSYDGGALEQPDLITLLSEDESRVFDAHRYSTEEPRYVADSLLPEAVVQFAAWARANHARLNDWLLTHRQHWVRARHEANVGRRFVYDLSAVQAVPEWGELVRSTGVSEEDLLYAFDVVLRFPLYGEFAGSEEFYLHHPIRSAISPAGLMRETTTALRPAIAFGASIAEMAASLDLQSYAKLLRNLRREVQENELHLVREGQVSDVELVRGIASRLGLPPRLRKVAKGTALIAGGVGAAGAISMIAPEASIVGGLITVLGGYWKGGLPASAGRAKWLQWAVEWDVEKQVGGGNNSR